MRRSKCAFTLATLFLFASAALTSSAVGDVFIFSDASGLSAEAEFTILDGGLTLEIRLRNTSTGVPGGFKNSDQLLTAISWDFGDPGFNGDPMITGGSVFTGPNSQSINFDIQNVGPNADVSGEWGYGNMRGTGLLTNFITASTAEATPFGGANLDGPVNIAGPEGGMVADPILVPLGGLGAIQDEIIAMVNLDSPIADLGFLQENHIRIEFGSNAFFIEIPADCPCDLNGDNVVDVLDLLQVLTYYGGPGGDCTGDGLTNVLDLLAVLSAWGDCG